MGLIRQRLHAWRGKRLWWVVVYFALVVALRLMPTDDPWQALWWFVAFVVLIAGLGLLGERFRRIDRAAESQPPDQGDS